MKKDKLNFLSFLFGLIILGFSFLISNQTSAASLSGRILLQVQDKGQAWYVDPINYQRHYLGRPNDAYNIMRNFGLGISNKDLSSFLSSQAPTRLAGKIILKVEDKGQAYYINPLNLKLYYLGRPDDAFNVIRSLGLGISNNDLNKISIGQYFVAQPVAPVVASSDIIEKYFSFKYKNVNQLIVLKLSPTLYKSYSKSIKIYSYPSNKPPLNLREAFYNIFFQTKHDDTSITELANALTALAKTNSWSDDELAESALALVQYIPYDQSKVGASVSNPFYPYETLYLNKGVCSDKTFLALAILKKLGFGAAIMDFKDINHSAVGISCPLEHSISGSGYCYGETTNYFPIGVVPNSINGQAQTGDYNFNELFNETKLGDIEILRKSSGKIYQGVAATKQKAAELTTRYSEISNANTNGLSYSEAVAYNEKVGIFNKLLQDFYQQ